MFYSEPKTFYDAIKPLIYFNCFAGLGAFRRSNQSATTYILMNIYTVILTLFNWATIYMTVGMIASFGIPEFTTRSGFIMYKVLSMMNFCVIVISPLLVWLRRKETNDFLRRLSIWNDTFPTLLGARNEYKKQHIRLIRRIVTIVSIVFSAITFNISTIMRIMLQMNFRVLLILAGLSHALHHSILVMFLLDLNFCTLMGYLESKFRAVNDSVLGLREEPSGSCPGERLSVVSPIGIKTTSRRVVSNTDADTLSNDKHYLLREIRKAHLELCKLSQKLNFAFGIQNLLSMGMCFVAIIGILYNIYSVLSSGNITNKMLIQMIGSAIWVAIYSIKIWNINHLCWRVSVEANRTGEVIYELLNPLVDGELLQEIQQFGVQMLQNPVRFNACGFFTLDYTCIQGVIGSTTTYLVILIQMSQLSECPTSDIALASNGTEISLN